MDGSDCSSSGSGVSGLTSGRVTLSTGATSVGDDAGCTWTGTGASFVMQLGGKLGIGATPGSLLTLSGDSSAVSTVDALMKLIGTSTAGLIFGSLPSSPWGMYLQTNNSGYPLLLQPAFGKVGIGTESPAQTLDVAGITRSAGVQYATGTRPTCDATARGTTWYVAGGAGVADTLDVCRKDAADAYAWVTLF